MGTMRMKMDSSLVLVASVRSKSDGDGNFVLVNFIL